MPLRGIGEAEFERLMAPLGPFGPGRMVAAAVSGGADSLALALLLRRWGRPLAVVADHGLRLESAAEAAATATRLRSIGVESVGVALGLQAGPGAGARAREARYAALLRVCHERGLPDLALGHHAQDQAETMMLRAGRGSGAAGLAGMAAVSWRGAARLLRPLLGVAPGRLRATLREAGLSWVEDPGNADPGTARGAMRRRGYPLGPYLQDGAELGAARARAEAQVAAELARGVTLYPSGYAVVRGAISEAAWSALLWTVSGRTHPPPREGVRRLSRRGGGTLHGVRVRGGVVAREEAAVGPAAAAKQGTVWDGRFEVRGEVREGWVGALGDEAGRLRQRGGAPAMALRTFPAVRANKSLLTVPHVSCPGGAVSHRVCMCFRPRRPLAGGCFSVAGWDGQDIGDAQTA